MDSSSVRKIGILGLAVVALVAAIFLFKKNRPQATVAIDEQATAVESSPEVKDPQVQALLEQVVQDKKSAGKPDSEVQKDLSKWPAENLQLLKQQALATNVDGDRRSAALYLLTQAGPAAWPLLTDVAATPLPNLGDTKDPHGAGSIQKTFELSLRIRALEALDTAAVKEPGLQKNLDAIVERQTDPTLRFLARVSQLGLQQGKPGKLQRFIDKALDEVEKKSKENSGH